MIDVHTPNSREFWTDLTGRSYYVFKVKACQEAYVKLAHRLGRTDIDSYEVRIGTESNTKTVIIPDPKNSHQESVDSPDVLHCNEYRPFWISWLYGTLYVGKGTHVWENELISYTDPTPHIINAAWMETAPENEGIFSIQKLDGEYSPIIEAVDPVLVAGPQYTTLAQH